MGSVLIVEAKPSEQVATAFSAGAVEACVGPFAKKRLDKAFSFAVCSGRVGPSAVVAQLRMDTLVAESVRSIPAAVVGKQGLDQDALAREPGAGAAHEASATLPCFVGQDLGVGN